MIKNNEGVILHDDICTCGHGLLEAHLPLFGGSNCRYCDCWKFKFDNLAYVERLAKDRNLI